MPIARCLIVVAFAVCVAACSQGGGAPDVRVSPSAGISPGSAAPQLIESKGFVMPLQDAVHKIGFRPFLPAYDGITVAVIPPLGNEDTPTTRGIAIEYRVNGAWMLLSQWPQQDFELAVGTHSVTRTPCVPVAFKRDGLIWTTRSRLAVTLQADGVARPGALRAEARRLQRIGICR